MDDDHPDDRAQRLVDKGFEGHPADHPAKQSDITRACTFLGYVFDEDKDETDKQKRSFFREVDSTDLLALGVLFRLREIRRCAVSTIKALCAQIPNFIKSTCWYNDKELWKASLGVINSTEAYLRFRKVAVDTLQPSTGPRLPAPTAPAEHDGQPRPSPLAPTPPPTVGELPSTTSGSNLLPAVQQFLSEVARLQHLTCPSCGAELGGGALLGQNRLASRKRPGGEEDTASTVAFRVPVSGSTTAVPEPHPSRGPSLGDSPASRAYTKAPQDATAGVALPSIGQLTGIPSSQLDRHSSPETHGEPPRKRQNIVGGEQRAPRHPSGPVHAPPADQTVTPHSSSLGLNVSTSQPLSTEGRLSHPVPSGPLMSQWPNANEALSSQPSASRADDERVLIGVMRTFTVGMYASRLLTEVFRAIPGPI